MRLPARSTRRGLYAAAVVLQLLAQLGALAHEASVRHVRCAEHGELVDAAVVEAVIAPPGDTRIVGVKGGATADDDHCVLASALRQQSAAPQASNIAIVHAPDGVAPPLLMVPRVVALTLYLIAPKTSPPDRSVLFT